MKITILLLMFWTGDRTSMVAPEYNSMQACQAALAQASKTFDHSWGLTTKGTYGVCTEK